jgi:hypothetical protein
MEFSFSFSLEMKVGKHPLTADIISHNNNNNNSVLYHLYAESTAARPITDTS